MIRSVQAESRKFAAYNKTYIWMNLFSLKFNFRYRQSGVCMFICFPCTKRAICGSLAKFEPFEYLFKSICINLTQSFSRINAILLSMQHFDLVFVPASFLNVAPASSKSLCLALACTGTSMRRARLLSSVQVRTQHVAHARKSIYLTASER